MKAAKQIKTEPVPRTRTVIIVLDPFVDPYTGENRGEGLRIDKAELEKAGWWPADFEAAERTHLIKQETVNG